MRDVIDLARRAADAVMDALVVPGYTRLGYRLRPHPPIDADPTGRRIGVTGATSGIGKAAAAWLAALGADVVAVGRNPDKLELVVGEIESDVGRGPETEVADLSLLADVRELAGRVVTAGPIHGLVNNAGALFGRRELTSEGIERNLALNLLSPFLLTNLVIPHMGRSAPARIVT